ncbi:MAG: alpha-hydroxy-acid oxidizing protein [Sphingomonadaceae bacterium]|nr:alpha-hydroxy-acid oxidizing protein [Sphingomonadaceae bacterium]
MTVFASIEDLRLEAQRRVPKSFFEYVEGGSYTEVTLAANRRDLEAVVLRQRLIGDVAHRSQATTILGQRVSMPLALAPTGLCGAVHARGEMLAAHAAKDFGVPFALSTMSIASIEDVAAEVGGDFWFQLYPMREERINASLLSRAKLAGCKVLILTIDAQTEGIRWRDAHNGLGVPPKLTATNIWGVLSHPKWALEQLRTPHITFGNLIGEIDGGGLAALSEWVKKNFAPTIDRALVDWVRAHWDGKLVIKGVLDLDDARTAVDAGADAIVVSNHGGRQLDGAASTVEAFPPIRDAVGDDVELYVDSGIRTGMDILRFLAMGARACLIGRAYMYGLGADGQAGVKCALDILKDELDRCMAMSDVADASRVERAVIVDRPDALSSG